MLILVMIPLNNQSLQWTVALLNEKSELGKYKKFLKDRKYFKCDQMFSMDVSLNSENVWSCFMYFWS